MLFDEYGEAIEADLLHHYGVDLLDLGSSRLTWRRLRNLINRLPANCETGRAIHGSDVQWGLPEQLMAAAVDALRSGNWQRAGNKKAKRPELIDRPGVRPFGDRKRRGTARMTPEQLQRRLQRHHRT